MSETPLNWCPEHAFISINKGYVFFRLSNSLGYKAEGSEPFASGNTRNHKNAEEALEFIKGVVRSYGVTSMEIHDNR